MSDSALIEAKSAMRAEALRRRASFNPAVGEQLSQHVQRECPPKPGAVVAGFWPIGSEIDIRPLMEALRARGHRIALPVTGKRGQALTFREWKPGAPLEPEPFGTMRPTGELLVPAYLLVPLLAFDRTGARLGYGAGYYDRTLALLGAAFAVGCAYAAQEVPAVPAGPGDVRLDAVATERGVIVCRDR